jgi:hypothetical protein
MDEGGGGYEGVEKLAVRTHGSERSSCQRVKCEAMRKPVQTETTNIHVVSTRTKFTHHNVHHRVVKAVFGAFHDGLPNGVRVERSSLRATQTVVTRTIQLVGDVCAPCKEGGTARGADFESILSLKGRSGVRKKTAHARDAATQTSSMSLSKETPPSHTHTHTHTVCVCAIASRLSRSTSAYLDDKQPHDCNQHCVKQRK